MIETDRPLTGRLAQRYCDCGGLRYGWFEALKVGPHLPQRAIRFTCANCGQERSCGVAYHYAGGETA